MPLEELSTVVMKYLQFHLAAYQTRHDLSVWKLKTIILAPKVLTTTFLTQL